MINNHKSLYNQLHISDSEKQSLFHKTFRISLFMGR